MTMHYAGLILHSYWYLAFGAKFCTYCSTLVTAHPLCSANWCVRRDRVCLETSLLSTFFVPGRVLPHIRSREYELGESVPVHYIPITGHQCRKTQVGYYLGPLKGSLEGLP